MPQHQLQDGPSVCLTALQPLRRQRSQDLPFIPLSTFTQILSNQAESYKDLISKYVDIDNELISAIQKSNKNLFGDSVRWCLSLSLRLEADHSE
jgi:hypothetical protein